MSAAEAGAPARLVVIDPSPAERERLAAAADALGVPVQGVDPRDLPPARLAALADARAIVVAWDCGVRVGLDVVEALAQHPETAGVPLAVAADAPTRAQVELALRAGARIVLRRPLDPAELARRLLDAEAAEAGEVARAGAEDAV